MKPFHPLISLMRLQPSFVLLTLLFFFISKVIAVWIGFGPFLGDALLSLATWGGFLWQDLLFGAGILMIYMLVGSFSQAILTVFFRIIFHLYSFFFLADIFVLLAFKQRFSFFEIHNVVSSVANHVFARYIILSVVVYLVLMGACRGGAWLIRKYMKKASMKTLKILGLGAIFLGLISNIIAQGSVGKEGDNVFVLITDELNHRNYTGPLLPAPLEGKNTQTLIFALDSTTYDRQQKRGILEHIVTYDPQFFLDNYTQISPTIESNFHSERIYFVEKAIHNLQSTPYKDYFSPIAGRRNTHNVIVLFLESYTAVDSKRTSGLNDNLPLFDSIQADGVTYTNFFSNANTSERGHIALLQGIEPLTFFKTSDTYYDLFVGYTEPLAQFFAQNGYSTHFVSTVSLEFLNQRKHLEKVGFENIIGEEAFVDRTMYGFDAAADEELYGKILDIIAQQTGSFFLAGQTISSHEPYNTPNGYSEQGMFSYVDQELFNFYQALKQENFFDDGILILVADHRKRETPSSKELDLYGKSAEGRILATMVGTGIEPSFDNTLYQHIDIFYSLKAHFGQGKVTVLNTYNDLFTKDQKRKWGLKEGGVNSKFLFVDQNNHDAIIKEENGIIRFSNTPHKEYSTDVITYLNSLYRYQQNTVRNKLKENIKPITIIAHRGDSENFLGNSMEAFVSAKNKGVDGIEFDVSRTADGYNIVYHGPSLESTICTTDAFIYELTLEEVKKCTLKNGEIILTLDEFLEKTKERFSKYVLEVKVHVPNHAKQQAYEAIQTVQKHNMQNQTIFVSYNELATYIFASFDDILSSIDSYNSSGVENLQNTNHSYFMSEYRSINSAILDRITLRNKQYMTYTVNDVDSLDQLYEIGVREFMTDNVDMAKEWKREKLAQEKK